MRSIKLALVSAPAGYSKTTFLAGWARSSGLPVAWLAMDKELHGVEHFLRYLLAGWEKAQPDIASSHLATQLGAQILKIDRVLAGFGKSAPCRGFDSLDEVI